MEAGAFVVRDDVIGHVTSRGLASRKLNGVAQSIPGQRAFRARQSLRTASAVPSALSVQFPHTHTHTELTAPRPSPPPSPLLHRRRHRRQCCRHRSDDRVGGGEVTAIGRVRLSVRSSLHANF